MLDSSERQGRTKNHTKNTIMEYNRAHGETRKYLNCRNRKKK